jgi:hypothetical protein
MPANRMVTVKLNTMGRIVDVKMTSAEAAEHRRRQRQQAEQERLMTEARKAIQRYGFTQDESDRKEALRAIGYYSLSASSEDRLSWVLRLIEVAPPGIFWPAIMEAWPHCDATWHDRTRLLRVLRAMPPAASFFPPERCAFFNTFPAQVTVFRGCSRPRVRGVAWTTDRAIAEGFAHGHRGISVPDPVVASAVILREDIFFVTDDRHEKEVVLDPRRLRSLMIEPYTAG